MLSSEKITEIFCHLCLLFFRIWATYAQTAEAILVCLKFSHNDQKRGGTFVSTPFQNLKANEPYVWVIFSELS
jgi:hypothetical protein